MSLITPKMAVKVRPSELQKIIFILIFLTSELKKNRYATSIPAYNAYESRKKNLCKYFETHQQGSRVLNHPFIEASVQL